MESKYLFCIPLLLVFQLCSSIVIGQIDSIGIPAEANSIVVEEFPNAFILTAIQNATKIEVFHFSLNSKGKTIKTDSADLMGFSVKKNLPQLYPNDVRKIQAIFSKKESYVHSNIKPKCGWHPDLAFKFHNGANTVTALVMAIPECNVAKFYWGEGESTSLEFFPARTELITFAKKVFSREYFSVPAIIERPILVTPVENLSERTSSKEETTKLVKVEIQKSKTYTWKKGDTWRKIARKFKVNKKELKALNNGIKHSKGLEINIPLAK